MDGHLVRAIETRGIGEMTLPGGGDALRLRGREEGAIERLDIGRRLCGARAAGRDAAIRAVMNPACSLAGLPPELYGGWKLFELNFDPSVM